MKRLLISVITIYQAVISPILHQLLGIQNACRFNPTCSAYMKHMITKHGIVKGGRMGIAQLLSCHPFSSYGAV